MSIFTDILIVGSALSFITGFLSLFVKKIQIKQKSRAYFLMALFFFALAVAIGWGDFVAGAYECPP